MEKKENTVTFQADIPVKSPENMDGYPYVIEKTYSATKRKWWQPRRMFGNREIIAVYTITFPDGF